MSLCIAIPLETICLFSNVATLETSKAECYLQCPVNGNDQRDVICWEPNWGQNNDHRHQASLWDPCSTYAGSCCRDTYRKKEISFTSDGLLSKKLHHVSTGAFLNHHPYYTSHCTELLVFYGQRPGQTARAGQIVCSGLNSHPLSLHWWGSSIVS